MRRRKRVIGVGLLGIGLALFGAVFTPQDRLIWNRTGSAPQGLYWLSDEPFTLGRWVVVSARSDDAQWAQTQGFVGRDWPLLKQIAGLPGDEICRWDTQLLINGKVGGEARLRDSSGRDWPLLKQIAGLPGDEICRWDTQLLINGKVGGEARLRDSSGRDLPSWEGCMVLGQDQLFLMNAHPDSLDGRYFGPVEIHDLVGVARLILAWR